MERILIPIIIFIIILTIGLISYRLGYILGKVKQLTYIEQILDEDLIIINGLKIKLKELHKLNNCNECQRMALKFNKDHDEKQI